MARRPAYVQAPPRFSRQWWLAGIRSFLLIAVASILIWVYADLEFTSTVELRATLRLTTGQPRQLLFADLNNVVQRDVEVAFRLRGARGLLTTYEQDLQQAGGIIEVDVTKSFGPGEHTLDVRDVLNRTPAIVRGGLTVTGATPSMVAVELNEAVEVSDVDVAPELTGASYTGLRVNPAKIAVWAPRSLLAELDPPRRVRTVPVELVAARQDQSFEAEIVPYLGPMRILPERRTVQVDVQVGELTATETFSVPVRLLIPPTWAQDDTWMRYRIVQKPPENWVRRIEISGPKRVLEELGARPDLIRAYLVLGLDDKKPIESWLPPRTVEVHFPPQLQEQLEVVGEPPTVIFRLEEKAPAAASP